MNTTKLASCWRHIVTVTENQELPRPVLPFGFRWLAEDSEVWKSCDIPRRPGEKFPSYIKAYVPFNLDGTSGKRVDRKVVTKQKWSENPPANEMLILLFNDYSTSYTLGRNCLTPAKHYAGWTTVKEFEKLLSNQQEVVTGECVRIALETITSKSVSNLPYKSFTHTEYCTEVAGYINTLLQGEVL
jgi:hypothetical protein